MEFKDKIKELRIKNNLTMEELANKVTVSTPTIQRYESGEIKNVRRDKIKLLADALNTTPSYLMGWDDDSLESDQTNEKNDNIFIAKNKEEKELLLLCRKVENIPEEQKKKMIENFKNTVDLYLQAKGIK